SVAPPADPVERPVVRTDRRSLRPLRPAPGASVMRAAATVSFAQSRHARRDPRNEVEILMPVVREAVERSGIERPFDFTCSGSTDFLQGQPFASVLARDAAGAWPPSP